MAGTKAELEQRLRRLEDELKLLQRQFLGITKKAKSAVLGSMKRRDAKKIDDIRARLSLK